MGSSLRQGWSEISCQECPVSFFYTVIQILHPLFSPVPIRKTVQINSFVQSISLYIQGFFLNPLLSFRATKSETMTLPWSKVVQRLFDLGVKTAAYMGVSKSLSELFIVCCVFFSFFYRRRQALFTLLPPWGVCKTYNKLHFLVGRATNC